MRRILIVAALLFACDVSSPARFVSDSGTDPCAPIFQPGETLFAELTCEQPPCTPTVMQNGCNLKITIGGCRDHELDAMIGADGVPIYEISRTAGSCVAVPTTRGARLSAECGGALAPMCRFDIYPAVDRSDEFTVTPLVIDDRPLRVPHPDGDGFFGYIDPLSGWLGGAAVLDDRIVVAKHGHFEMGLCTRTPSSSFALVDLDTFAITATVPAPPCPIDLVASPFDDRFLAGYGGLGHPTVGLFDKDGALVKSATITVNADQILTDIAISGDTLVVLISSPIGTSIVASFHARTLEPGPVSGEFEAMTRTILPVRPGGLAISTNRFNGLRLLGGDLSFSGVLQLRSGRFSSNDPGAMETDRSGDLALVAATGGHATIWALDFRVPEPILGEGVPYERAAIPWALAPFDQTTMLAGVTERNETKDASLALFAIDRVHFLPGWVPLGHGVIRSFSKDTRGNFYALLPWEGRLVRIAPRR